MVKRRLTEVVPVRLSRQHKIGLRRLAREQNVDVSDVVRDLIEERLGRSVTAAESGAPAGAASEAA